jgi:hypothetical protein
MLSSSSKGKSAQNVINLTTENLKREVFSEEKFIQVFVDIPNSFLQLESDRR